MEIQCKAENVTLSKLKYLSRVEALKELLEHKASKSSVCSDYKQDINN